MGTTFFTLHKIPDFTLAKYSAMESTDVRDVVRLQKSFLRQLNRKGLLFDEIYHLIYLYHPQADPGKRLLVYLRADSRDDPVQMGEFLHASSLGAYYELEEEVPSLNPVFSCRATMARQDGFMGGGEEKDAGYYVVDPIKPSDNARLMGLFRMMKRLDVPAAYTVTLKAADLTASMQEGFRGQMEYIRKKQRLDTQPDEAAREALRAYETFFTSLRSNPHFYCYISAYAQDEATAKMFLDAAASDGIEEGNYRIISERGSFTPMIPEMRLRKMCLDETPKGMRGWNSTYLLKEIAPFFMLPALFPAELIEIPKESAPVYEKNGIRLGKDEGGYDVYLPLSFLPRHALLSGVPGSGKTFSMLTIASQLGGDFGIPFLILEPAKKEYRALARHPKLENFLVFSPGGEGRFPLRVNPFEFPVGVKLSEHITSLISVFEGAFDLDAPMPFLVSSGIEAVYRNHGWYPFEINDGTREYPTIRELYDELARLLDVSDYADEVKSNLKSRLQVRIGSLITREMGNIFDVPSSSVRPEEWMNIQCVVELEALGADASNFLTLLLLTTIREVLRKQPKADKSRPRHVIFLEEAHNLIGPVTVANDTDGNAKVASTNYIVNMLAEVRALQEAIIIADQLPTSLADQVTKNTSLKIAHKMTAIDDRQMLCAVMSADAMQFERMGLFSRGHALCTYEDILKPFEIQIEKYAEDAEPPESGELYDLMKNRPGYMTVMHRDFAIMQKKNAKRLYRILQDYQLILHNTADAPSLKSVSDRWLEHVVETKLYVRMNRMENRQGKEWILKETKEFMKYMVPAYQSDESAYDAMIERIRKA